MTKKLITVIEAAKFLKVNEAVIDEMIKAGTFSSEKAGKTVKIDKNQLDEWLSNLNDTEEKYLAKNRTVCRFQDYFRADSITLDFDADNKYESIGFMSKKAKEIKLVRDHIWLYEVVLAREELVSTAVGKGVALLHPRHMHPTKIKTPSILFARSKEGVEFDAPDNKPVRLFFMLLLHNDKQHLFSLSYISKLLMNEKNLERLLTVTTNEEIVSILSGEEN